MTTVDAFLDQFKLAAALYDRRLLQLNIKDDPDRYKPATEIAAEKLSSFGLSNEVLTRALEQYQRGTYTEQEQLIVALTTDFARAVDRSTN